MRDKIVQAMYDLTAPAHYPEEVADVVMALLAEQPTITDRVQYSIRFNRRNWQGNAESIVLEPGRYALVRLSDEQD